MNDDIAGEWGPPPEPYDLLRVGPIKVKRGPSTPPRTQPGAEPPENRFLANGEAFDRAYHEATETADRLGSLCASEVVRLRLARLRLALALPLACTALVFGAGIVAVLYPSALTVATCIVLLLLNGALLRTTAVLMYASATALVQRDLGDAQFAHVTGALCSCRSELLGLIVRGRSDGHPDQDPGLTVARCDRLFALNARLGGSTSIPAAREASAHAVRTTWRLDDIDRVSVPRVTMIDRLHLPAAMQRAPFRSLGIAIALLVVPIAVATVLPIMAVAFWVVLFGAFGAVMLWESTHAPLIDGVLRAHLHHFATSGSAAQPFTDNDLATCVRTRPRGTYGLADQARTGRGPVRSGSEGATAQDEPLPATATSTAYDFAQLIRDKRVIIRVLEKEPSGMTNTRLVQVSELSSPRCRDATHDLVRWGDVRVDMGPHGVVYRKA